MISTIIATREYRVSVEAFDLNGDMQFSHEVSELSFMQAADYSEHAVNYFKFAMLDHSNWIIVQIEVTHGGRLVEAIEIKRDVI